MVNRASHSRVLLVDDDRIVLNTLGHGLRKADYVVEQCASGSEAFAAYRANIPDLAIVDIGLPDMRGTALAKMLLKHQYRPILILSSHSEPEWVDQAIGSGVIGYLVKPLSVEQLIPSIETALARCSEINRRVAKKFGYKEMTERQLLAAMDQFSFGVVIIDQDHHIIHSNSLARKFLSEDGALINSEGKLSSRTRKHEFTAMLNVSLGNSGTTGPAMISLDGTQNGVEIQVWGAALPLAGEDCEQSAIIVINDPTLMSIAPSNLLKTLYGLTAKESKLARGLIDGLTINQYCARSFISPNTARSHLKSIYRKTTTNRQADLIRLLSRLFINPPNVDA